MRLIFFLLSLLLFFLVEDLYSQSFEKLMQERQALLEQLEEAEEQTSSILGKKSKKDLRNATEIQKEIIEKDSEIIAALQREVNRKEIVTQTVSNPENEQKIIELESQLANLSNQANQKNIKTVELEQRVATVQDRMFKYQSTILITLLIIFLLTLYISRLRKKNKAQDPQGT